MKIQTKRGIAFVVAITIALLASIAWLAVAASMTEARQLPQPVTSTYRKPVIVLLYDSLRTETLQQLTDAGQAPAFEFLMKHGNLYKEVVSAYPTMSVSIDSTLLTGTYADQHQIPGLLWFNEQENKLISYGSGPHEVLDNGVKSVLQNGVIYLNGTHLSRNVSTLYERLADQHISSASINGMIYRGRTPHTLYPPQLLARASLLPTQINVTGPEYLSVGLLSQYNTHNDAHNYAWNRFGFNNAFSVNELTYLLEKQSLPAFTLAYLPDADAALHRNGPDDTQAITHADQALQQLFNQFTSWEEALEQAVWIVLGDSNQSYVKANKEDAHIDMDKLLANYSRWTPKATNSQLALALNERMAYIHLLDSSLSKEDIAMQFQHEERIRFIAWHNNNEHIIMRPNQKERFVFSKGGALVDSYGQAWSMQGDSSILDITLDTNNNRFTYDEYPDALARLYGALHAQQGNVIIVEAAPGYELHDHNSYNHTGGGSHGSLHKVDSVVPLIAAGTTKPLYDQRLVALQQWLLELVLEQQL